MLYVMNLKDLTLLHINRKKMKAWDDINYQKIQRATLETGTLYIHFQNGDDRELPIKSVLPLEIDSFDEASLIFNDYDIVLKSDKGDFIIPWDKIRILSDKDFAQAMAQKAEEHSRLIGNKIKSMRERKGIKSNDLAERAGITPQTITRIEKGHTDIGFSTLRKILASMGYSLKDLANHEISSSINETPWSIESLFKRLSGLGVDNQLANKIIPKDILRGIKGAKDVMPDLIQNEIATYFSRVFGWTKDDLWNNGSLQVSDQPAQLAFFKTPSKGNLSQIRAYSHYAYYLANIVSKVNSRPPVIEYPGDLEEFKQNFYSRYDALTLQNLLDYTWKLGICVIPLNDQGIFHGASWNINDNHVIVLKQRNDSHARWIFDLLHELYHVFVHLDKPNTSVVETEELNPFGNNDTPEELEANSFANQFIFGHQSEDIAKEALEKAKYKVEYLKKAVTEVADKEKVNAEFIANYLAFRLQMTGVNWWGVANSFQITDPSPFIIASATLKSNIQIENLNPIDKNLLNSAINN